MKCDGVSERHAQLTVNFDELLVENLDFTNGMFVNGRPVDECVRVWPNQKIQIGAAVIEVHRLREPGDDDPSLAPQAAAVHRALPEEFLRERKYEIGGLVAEGGMGAILNAYEATTGRTVAMKVVLSNPQPSALMRFIKEAQITSQLEHPNIVPLHELGIDEQDQVFYTMKMVQGITLKRILEIIAHGTSAERAKYSLRQLLTIFQKVCDAIGFAHSRGVVHRDLKPDNIMIGEYGEVLAMDWGLAKILGDSDLADRFVSSDAGDSRDTSGSATMAGAILGTPQYMPPEQARGEVDAQDQRSDIYSLGAILYQILALRAPVSGDSAAETIENVCAGRIAPLRASAGHDHWPIPASLAAVAMKALAMNPADRYSSVQELQADIAAFQSGFATEAEHAGLLKQLVLLVGRHKREAAILAVGIVALLGIATFAFARVTRERSAARNARKIAETERSRAQDARAHTVAERARAESEKNRASAALADLRKAAPAFQGQAATLIEEQKFDEALEKNRMAIQLTPDDADRHLFRAHTLQAMQRLPGAIESYRRVIELRPGDAAAKSNLELCERLLAESAGKPLNRAQQTQLLDAILAQQRTADSVLLARALGRQTDVGLALIQSQLKSLMLQEKWNEARLKKRADGTFALDLSNLVVPDLSILRGLPIGALKLGPGTVTDLGPLATLPLKELDCSGNPVRDLAPLRGLPIERLNISKTKVADLAAVSRLPLRQLAIGFTEITDLRPLRAMPLQTLSLAGLPIRSIEPLRGLRLRELDLFACSHLSDLSPLTSLVDIQSVNLPAQINDLSFVSQVRTLRRLGNSGLVADGTAFDKLPTVSEFFATQGQRLAREKQFGPRLEALRNMLRKFGAPESKIAEVVLDSQGFMNLDIGGTAITNLSALSGLPIRNLVIKGTRAADLTPLSGMPLVSLDASESPISNLAALATCNALKVLDVHGTDVADLRPLGRLKLVRLALGRTRVQDVTVLRGMPLVELDLSDCRNLTNLSPLLGCTRLETLLVPASAADIGALLRIPSLRRLSDKPLASFGGDWTKVPPARAFRPAVVNLDPLRSELRRLGMPEEKVAAIQFFADGMLDLDLRKLPIENLEFLKGLPIRTLLLDDCPVSDLSPLAGAPIQRIEMRRTKVSNLEPLRGAPLEFLEAHMSPISDLSPLEGCRTLRALRIAGTQVADLTPVLGLPLTTLHIKNTKVADVSPLAACETLEVIEISLNAPGTAALRKMPRLRTIASVFDNTNKVVALTAEEFWLEFDAQANASKMEPADFQVPAAEVTRGQLSALKTRATSRLRSGRLKEAAADFNRTAELDPVDMRFLEAAPLLVHAGDLASYRSLCQRALELFANSTNPEVCERIAKICSLHAGAGVDTTAATKLADSALALGSGNKRFLTWAHMTKGLVEYRAGRFPEASVSLETSLTDKGAPEPLRAATYAALAMAKEQSKHRTEARAALAQAAEILGEAFAQPEGVVPVKVSDAWQDWLFARIIFSEAHTLIRGTPGTPKP